MRKENTYHHGDLRADLIKVARKRLVRDGYEALSLRDLAREAGVSASAPYAHFESRDDLFNALIQDGAQTLAALFDSAAAVPGPPRAMLAAVCHAYLEFAVRRREMFRLMFASPVLPSPVFEGEAQAVLDRFEALVAACLGIDVGMTARQVALTCWSTMHGFAMLRLHRRTHVGLTDQGADELIVDAVLRLAVQKPSRDIQ